MANCRHIENRFSRIFRFPTAFWASASGDFRIVSDTLVNLSVITIYCCHRQTFSLTLAVVVGPWVWGDAKKLPGQLSRPRPRPRPIGHKNGLEAKAWPRGRATSEDITGSTSLVFLASFQDIRTCLAYMTASDLEVDESFNSVRTVQIPCTIPYRRQARPGHWPRLEDT